MMARAATDWLFEACHPAPASAFSTRTAKMPKTRTTSSQAMSTLRKWVAAQRPSRANGLGRPAWRVASAPRLVSRCRSDRSSTSVPTDTRGELRPVPRVAVMWSNPLIRPAPALEGPCADTWGGMGDPNMVPPWVSRHRRERPITCRRQAGRKHPSTQRFPSDRLWSRSPPWPIQIAVWPVPRGHWPEDSEASGATLGL